MFNRVKNIRFHRKLRRFQKYIRQHSTLILSILTILILIIIFREEITYQLYIRTLDVQPYQNALTLWSSDYHIRHMNNFYSFVRIEYFNDTLFSNFSPIQDLKTILVPFGVQFFDKSLSYSCQRTRTCLSHIRVLTNTNGMNFSDQLASEFYEFYKNQTEMNLVDAFVCFHPVSMCELYMQFNRSMIVISSTRYELARFQPDQWMKLNENLKKIAQDPKNFVAANNLYDAEYIRYFTGMKVPVLPSLCNYTNADYNPKRSQFLLAPIHSLYFDDVFKKLLKTSFKRYQNHTIKIVPIRNLYPNYKYSDLTNHPAIIHVPYQVSIMSVFEQYRMNIPLVFPSLNLLTKWHYEYGVVAEKTWEQAFNERRSKSSRIKGVLTDVPDPNNDYDRSAIRYWLNFSDFYQWPHITYYESADDLISKLISTDFRMISKQMNEYNRQVGESVVKKWKEILNNIKQYSKKFQ
ncbi:unnamed protein product [Rotaria socialis]|nr:unnamed protein product [Rotaria socialis]